MNEVDVEEGRMYMHNDEEYYVTVSVANDSLFTKNSGTSAWSHAIIYTRDDDTELREYVRTIGDFCEKFSPVEE